MGRQENRHHISLWLENDLYKRCESNRMRGREILTRTEYVTNALEFYNEYLKVKDSEEYINDKILGRMEAMLSNLENRIGRQMFKSAVESAKIAHVLANEFDIEWEELNDLHVECTNEVKKINGAITFPSAKRNSNE